jgi:hypothetical protein
MGAEDGSDTDSALKKKPHLTTDAPLTATNFKKCDRSYRSSKKNLRIRLIEPVQTD